MKKMSLFLAAIIFLCGSEAYSFYTPLSDEPLAVMEVPASTPKGEIRFGLQHYFSDNKINSANLRAGYGLTDRIELLLSGMYHSLSASVQGNDYELVISEPEAGMKIRIAGGSILSASLLATASSFSFRERQTAPGQPPDALFTDNFYAVSLPAQIEAHGFVLILLSPMVIYNSGAGVRTAVSAGLKIILWEDYAFFIEAPFGVAGKKSAEQMWSAGFQFKAGPHFMTVFMSNSYCFTNSGLLDPVDLMSAGFRYSF